MLNFKKDSIKFAEHARCTRPLSYNSLLLRHKILSTVRPVYSARNDFTPLVPSYCLRLVTTRLYTAPRRWDVPPLSESKGARTDSVARCNATQCALSTFANPVFTAAFSKEGTNRMIQILLPVVIPHLAHLHIRRSSSADSSPRSSHKNHSVCHRCAMVYTRRDDNSNSTYMRSSFHTRSKFNCIKLLSSTHLR